MSKIFMMALLVIALGSVAINSESAKASNKLDTVMVIKPDTVVTKKINYDTTFLVKAYKDSLMLVKIDTLKPKHKAVK